MHSDMENPQYSDFRPDDTMPHLLLEARNTHADEKSIHPWSSYDDISLDQKDLNDQQYMLLTPLLVGYALNTKQWGIFEVGALHDIEQDPEPLSMLKLNDDHLRLIKSICNRFKSNCPKWKADFVHGKGAGQIVMIHGPPGMFIPCSSLDL